MAFAGDFGASQVTTTITMGCPAFFG
jgi:hypothetical protein